LAQYLAFSSQEGPKWFAAGFAYDSSRLYVLQFFACVLILAIIDINNRHRKARGPQRSDVGFPSPDVFSSRTAHQHRFGVRDGCLRRVRLRLPEGSARLRPQRAEGKTILIGSAGWRAIIDPMFARAGIDPASIRYAEMGNSWAKLLAQSKGDAALSSEGLRAQGRGLGFDFEYLLGREFSKVPANVSSFAAPISRTPRRKSSMRLICAAGPWASSSATSTRGLRRTSR
jgi:hypothetical protein